MNIMYMECTHCHKNIRVDEIKNNKCPECGAFIKILNDVLSSPISTNNGFRAHFREVGKIVESPKTGSSQGTEASPSGIHK
jgi:NAD-dependent SIR2 family protein deacetylase